MSEPTRLPDWVLAGYERRGRADAAAGRQPSPPLREDGCTAYWQGYRAGQAGRRSR